MAKQPLQREIKGQLHSRRHRPESPTGIAVEAQLGEFQRKGEAIKEALKKYPQASAAEIVELLQKGGVQVREMRVAAMQRRTAYDTQNAAPERAAVSEQVEKPVARRQAILAAIEKHSDQSLEEINQALKSQGIDIPAFRLAALQRQARLRGSQGTLSRPKPQEHGAGFAHARFGRQQAIQDTLAQHHNKPVEEIVRLLAEQGIDVPPQRIEWMQKRATRMAGRRDTEMTSQAPEIPEFELMRARQFVRSVGSLARAIELLNRLKTTQK